MNQVCTNFELFKILISLPFRYLQYIHCNLKSAEKSLKEFLKNRDEGRPFPEILNYSFAAVNSVL